MTEISTQTVFERIWDGTIPARELYRNEELGILAILDIRPAQPGHTLIIPREPVRYWEELELRRWQEISTAAHYMAQIIKQKLDPDAIHTFTSGYDVPHMHLHVVPSYDRGDFGFMLDPRRMEHAPDSGLMDTMHGKLKLPNHLAEELTANLDLIGL